MARAYFVKKGNKCRKGMKKKRVGRGKKSRYLCVSKKRKKKR